MPTKSIVLDRLTVAFNSKVLFSDFSTQIYPGSRIAIIGQNGTGKTTLFNCILGSMNASSGKVIVPSDTICGFVPQIIHDFDKPLSGGQRFNYALTRALAKNPDVLCLDEPTNHLDGTNRKSLLRMLNNYLGTLIVISHDVELLCSTIDQIWHIENGGITIFYGSYNDFQREQQIFKAQQHKQHEELSKQKKKFEKAFQDEQKRAAQSKKANSKENDKNLLGAMKQSGDKTAGKLAGKISKHQDAIAQELSNIRINQDLIPTFAFRVDRKISSEKYIVSISDGSCGYTDIPLLEKISLYLDSSDRIAILGSNGSGKSTFIKALLQNKSIIKNGVWSTPNKKEIGYLDQYYEILNPSDTVLQTIEYSVPEWSHNEVRRHLNNFLFKSNEAVNAQVINLSGGEKARLALAQIAVQNPTLLILDEVTNNLDLQAREHVINTLSAYDGALIVISHDQDFLNQINITEMYTIKDGIFIVES